METTKEQDLEIQEFLERKKYEKDVQEVNDLLAEKNLGLIIGFENTLESIYKGTATIKFIRLTQKEN